MCKMSANKTLLILTLVVFLYLFLIPLRFSEEIDEIITEAEVSEAVEIEEDDLCKNTKHEVISGRGITCCQNETLVSGITHYTYFEECAITPNNSKEDYGTALWRIYICILKRSIPEGQQTISIAKFSKIMTADYPEDLRDEINNKIQTIVSNEKNKKWLTVEVRLTDWENIDRLRVDYFNIEKQVCGNLDPLPSQEVNGKVWTKCSSEEEEHHRGGTCCQNITLPIEHYEYQTIIDPSDCRETLNNLIESLKSNDTDYIENVEAQCEVSCYLIEHRVIKIAELIELNAKKDLDTTDHIVKGLVPQHFSATVLKILQDTVKRLFRISNVHLGPGPYIGNQSLPGIFGCHVHRHIYNLLRVDAYPNMCYSGSRHPGPEE